jgi:hypothetical protein
MRNNEMEMVGAGNGMEIKKCWQNGNGNGNDSDFVPPWKIPLEFRIVIG